ncbi:MAG: tetratricopeptide repeat protein [Candidatus Eremiobacteraeota bacterium]|nr:tetratricopeptide repeat protein [Candidatus Eremiobacteraeota bacterium]
MKRFALVVLIAVAGTFAALSVASPNAQAGVFGGKKSSGTPTPSPSPSALPTATPEPPSVAIPRLQAKLKANPNDQQAMLELAAEFLQIGKPNLTLELTQHLLQQGDKSAQVYYYDGFAQGQLGNLPGAIADLEQASNLDPTNMTVLAQLADMYLRSNRPTDAERVAKRAVTFNKTEPTALEALGSVYAAEQKYDDARTEFEAALALNPKDPSAIFQIASTYMDQNNIPLALQSIDRALALDPKSVEALAFKASLYAKQHDDAKTSEAYDDAVVAATTDDVKVQLMLNKASYFLGERKTTEGQAVLQQIVTQYPHVSAGFVAYGNFYAQQRQYSQAQTQWQAALAIDPDDPGALLGLGEISMQQGHATDTINYLKHYTQVSPDAQGFALLGQAYSMTHDFNNMKDACTKSFAIQREPATLSCIAGADFELRNYKEAAQIFDVLDKAAKDFVDRDPQLLFMAAKTYQNANQCGKSQEAYKRLLAIPGLKTQAPTQYSAVQKAMAEPCGQPAKKKSS